MKIPGKSTVKIAISVVMLGLVLSIADIASLKRTILSIPPKTIFMVVVLYGIGQIMSSFKWFLIARSGKIASSYPLALKSYFIGMYVNCFGLGTLGGDVTRGILLADGRPMRTEAVASVVADRVHGLGVIAVIGIVANLVFRSGSLNTFYELFLYGLLAGIIVGWAAGPAILLRFIPVGARIRPRVERLAKVFPKDWKTLGSITAISFLFHLLQIGIHFIMASGVGAAIGTGTLLTRVPIVNILSSLPVSWQGLGVREASYLFFMGDVLTNEQAVAFGAMWLFAITISSAVGGIVSVLTGDLRLINRDKAVPASQAE